MSQHSLELCVLSYEYCMNITNDIGFLKMSHLIIWLALREKGCVTKWKKLKCRRGWCCRVSSGLFVLIVNVN